MKSLKIFLLIGLSFLFFSNQLIASQQNQFFKWLKPVAENVNQKILLERQKIINFQQNWQQYHKLSTAQKHWLAQTARKYRLNSLSFNKGREWNALLQRVDIVPMSMILAQAATESGWGTSRFAKVAKNYFGQWCFRKGCGIVPLRRTKGKIHEIKKFANIKESVTSYIHNLNTNENYQIFRSMRASLRKRKNTISGIKLATGLTNYSELGDEYVRSIQQMIRIYRLTQLDKQTGIG